MTVLEAVLNSPVVSTTITVVGSVLLTALTFIGSRKKNKKRFKKEAKQFEYQKYENLITQQGLELKRVYEVAEEREKLIQALRVQIEAMYKSIDEKNNEIDRLRHVRKFTAEALRLGNTDKKSK